MPNVDPSLRGIVRPRGSFPLRMAAVGLTAALLSGCPTPGSSSSVGGGGAPKGTWTPVPIRDPDACRVHPLTLTPDEQIRQEEVGRYLAGTYQQKHYKVKATIQMPSGDIYDWVEATSVPGSDAEPPPSPCPDCQLPNTELSLCPELRGPPGTMPFVRSSFFNSYIRGGTGATSVEDFIRRFKVKSAPPG